MIISRKKYEEAIERAKREVEERFWQNKRIERFESDTCRRFEGLERRVFAIESQIGARSGEKTNHDQAVPARF